MGLVRHAESMEFSEHSFRFDIEIDPFLLVHLPQISADL